MLLLLLLHMLCVFSSAGERDSEVSNVGSGDGGNRTSLAGQYLTTVVTARNVDICIHPWIYLCISSSG